MTLKVADIWYESLKINSDLTLIYEPHVHPDLRCNIWHIKGRDRDMLIDSGLGVASLRDYLGQISDKEFLAVASHTHFDHIGCHHEFEHRLCHPLEAHVLDAPNSQNTVWSEYRVIAADRSQFDALPFAGFRLGDYKIEPAPPTRLIDEGDLIDLGNRHFSVFHMPGHSPGSVCLYEAATKTLFTGDVLYDGELLDTLYHSDREVYAETLARLKELPAETFHCGHYASFGKQRMLELIDNYMELQGANILP
jgi:glyoxylase-like metal-dependent hydrolase (beta-lactamase superfamily II)